MDRREKEQSWRPSGNVVCTQVGSGSGMACPEAFLSGQIEGVK